MTTRPEVLLFCHTSGPFGCFSNFFKAPFHFELPAHAVRAGFPSHFECEFGEKAIMATKAAMMGDLKSFKCILAEAEPLQCKYLGRYVTPFDLDHWNKYLDETATAVCVARFSHSKALWDILNSTGEALLAEASASDTVWGIGLSIHDPDAMNPARWRGANVLGRALVAARTIIRSKEALTLQH